LRNVYLLTCSRRKTENAATAKDLYTSPSFIAARKIAEKEGNIWYIISAKHGLIDPEKKIEPYDLSLQSLSEIEKEKWALKVVNSIIKNLDANDKIIFLGDDFYFNYLYEKLQLAGFNVTSPLFGKTIDEKMHWLNAYGQESQRLSDLNTFYKLLSELSDGLGGLQLFKDFKPGPSFPKKGVYYFFEEGETRYNSHLDLRVVRVGTHAVSSNSKSTLWQRLRTHRGTADGSGSHRSSIMRLYIGASLIKKSHGMISAPTWGIGQSTDNVTREIEAELEKEVSAYIGNMKILWLSINDENSAMSDRAYIERNSIALLTGRNGPLDLPSKNWLGNYCPNQSVRTSGLWNVDFVDNFYDEKFLEIFSRYVDITLGKKEPSTNSIAPHNWFKKKLIEKNPTQMELSWGQ
jgi:hypothetical protein